MHIYNKRVEMKFLHTLDSYIAAKLMTRKTKYDFDLSNNNMLVMLRELAVKRAEKHCLSKYLKLQDTMRFIMLNRANRYYYKVYIK